VDVTDVKILNKKAQLSQTNPHDAFRVYVQIWLT